MLPDRTDKVDILLVVDNSGSMGQEQEALMQQFRRALAALRREIPAFEALDLRIGVISSDLGAGDYALPSCEAAGGDRGRLQSTPRLATCTAPSDPWVAVQASTTNIPGCAEDAESCAARAVRCIGYLGLGGCGFEHHLESVLWAVDPLRNTNPGFLRDDAVLAVLILSDEDDCSAQRPELFDPADQSLDGALGPLTSFRCFEYGIRCDINDRFEVGPREGCEPAGDWLYPPARYVDVLTSLKTYRDRVVVAAIAGPADKVMVKKDGPNPVLGPACQTQDGFAQPAIRIDRVVRGFRGPFGASCAYDYGPLLDRFGQRVARAMDSTCLVDPLLTEQGGLACHPSLPGCEDAPNCLSEVACQVRQALPAGAPDALIPRCEKALFDSGKAQSYTGPGCWRLIPRPIACDPATGVAPYGIEVLGATKGSGPLELRCRRVDARFSDAETARMPRCSSSS